MDFIKAEYKKEWQFFKSKMKIMFPVMLIGFIALAVGSHYAFANLYKQDVSYLTVVMQTLEEAMSGIDLSNDSIWLSMVKLFFNNARVSLMAISIGIIPLLCLPFIFYLSNSIIIGMVTSFAGAVGGFSISFFLASLLPHGIFEIPAIIYSCALGLYLCKETTMIIFKRSNRRLGEAAADVLRSYVLVILPLLILACVIEPTLTMEIAMRFV